MADFFLIKSIHKVSKAFLFQNECSKGLGQTIKAKWARIAFHQFLDMHF